MEEFQIGDRVRCTNKYDGNRSIVGKKGTVCCLLDDKMVGVEFDKPINVGHNCHRRCKDGHGWFIPVDFLVLEPPTAVASIEFAFDAFMDGGAVGA